MVQFLLLDARYVVKNGETEIELFGKDEKGETVFVELKYDPYLYIVPEKITDEVVEKIKKVEQVKRIEKLEMIVDSDKRKVLKVYVKTPPDTTKVRDILKDKIGHDNFFEYAISFPKKFLMDHQISPGEWIEIEGNKIKKVKPKKVKLKKLGFDIETYEEGGKSKIIMISFYGEKFRKVITYKDANYQNFVEVVENEKELLERFVKTIVEEDPDVIFGYNSDEFDFKMIEERAEENKVKLSLGRDGSEVKFVRRARTSSAKIWGRIHLDLFSFVSNILSPHMETEVLTLGEVSSEILGDEKIEMDLEEMLESWRKGENLRKFVEYCLKDSELTYRLGEKLFPQILELSKLIGQPPFDVSRMTYSQLVEWYLSKRAVAEDRIIPNQPKYEDIQRRRMKPSYTGGFVKEPIEGLHENIAVLDFKSLYPTIMATFNISPETLNCECCKDDGHKVPELGYWFCKKKKGFISSVVEEIIKKRFEVKEKMKKVKDPKEREDLDREQYALKIIANSTYGYLAYVGSKWYCFECAQSASAFGRFYIKKIIDEAEKEGFQVIYGDTDSVFLEAENIEVKSKKFLEKINNELPGIMQLDLQGIYRRGLFVVTKSGKGAKKRYALVDDEGNLTIRGFETVRRDWCNLAKEVQRNVLRYILEKNDVKGAVEYVKDVVKRIKNREIELKEFIIYEQLTKSLEEYEQIGPHVVAAKKMKERGESVGPGSIIMFVIREGSGSISDRAEPVEDMDLNRIDTQYYIDHQIIPAALRVLEVLGVTKEELKGGGKQLGLKGFG
ncbi:MAG: ribonuclease H-like domain-containing protein [Candidatus Aenigmarchaeota archaeon]|nr:ribonuclease H-like domain-containing protein [Candidatus Aenigmarchaeota archaeon]